MLVQPLKMWLTQVMNLGKAGGGVDVLVGVMSGGIPYFKNFDSRPGLNYLGVVALVKDDIRRKRRVMDQGDDGQKPIGR